MFALSNKTSNNLLNVKIMKKFTEQQCKTKARATSNLKAFKDQSIFVYRLIMNQSYGVYTVYKSVLTHELVAEYKNGKLCI